MPKPRLLIAYDGSDVANAAVRSAAELFPGCAALIVTVWEPGLGATAALAPGLDAAGTVAVPLDPELASDIDKAQEHHAAVVSREGARLAGSLGLDARPHPIPDKAHVADTIVELADSGDETVVVIGSHGITGLRSHLLGSTSRHVLAHCKLPVLVVRAPEGR